MTSVFEFPPLTCPGHPTQPLLSFKYSLFINNPLGPVNPAYMHMATGTSNET